MENKINKLSFKSDIKRLCLQIDNGINLLENKNFLTKAPLSKVNEIKKKIYDWKINLNQIRYTIDIDINNILEQPYIDYFIQEIRDYEYDGELYSIEHLENYNEPAKDYEIEQLINYYNTGKLNEIFKHNLRCQ